jgi:hypothetical protein
MKQIWWTRYPFSQRPQSILIITYNINKKKMLVVFFVGQILQLRKLSSSSRPTPKKPLYFFTFHKIPQELRPSKKEPIKNPKLFLTS